MPWRCFPISNAYLKSCISESLAQRIRVAYGRIVFSPNQKFKKLYDPQLIQLDLRKSSSQPDLIRFQTVSRRSAQYYILKKFFEFRSEPNPAIFQFNPCRIFSQLSDRLLDTRNRHHFFRSCLDLQHGRPVFAIACLWRLDIVRSYFFVSTNGTLLFWLHTNHAQLTYLLNIFQAILGAFALFYLLKALWRGSCLIFMRRYKSGSVCQTSEHVLLYPLFFMHRKTPHVLHFLTVLMLPLLKELCTLHNWHRDRFSSNITCVFTFNRNSTPSLFLNQSSLRPLRSLRLSGSSFTRS